MRVGIISDTHGQVDFTRPALRMFESLDVERVLHCGDIGSSEVVELFERWPTDFVFGNCDMEQRAALDDFARAKRVTENSATWKSKACGLPCCTATIAGCFRLRSAAVATTRSAMGTRTWRRSNDAGKRCC